MSRKKFTIVLICIFILLSVLTFCHLGYDMKYYKHSSIIYFIAKERW